MAERIEYRVSPARAEDVDAAAELYGESIDWLLGRGIRQWRRAVYPTPETARNAFAEGSLYVCRAREALAGTVILNRSEPEGYAGVAWRFPGPALVVHTLAARPAFCGRGAGSAMMRFALELAAQTGCACIRLDAYPGNPDPLELYRKLGFTQAGAVSFPQKEPGCGRYLCFERAVSAAPQTVSFNK